MSFTWHKTIDITFFVNSFISCISKEACMISWRKKVVFRTHHFWKCYCTFLTQRVKHKSVHIPNIFSAFNTISTYAILELYLFWHDLDVSKPLQPCSNVWRHKFLHDIMRCHFDLLLIAHYIDFKFIITFN